MACSTTLLLFCFVVVGIFAYPLDNKQENETVKDSFQPVSLPTDFGSYDPNANGYIDLEELAKVTGTTLDDARKPFMDADIDDDDQVSPSEFERAPWTLSTFNRELVPEDDSDDQIDNDNDEEDIHIQDDDDQIEDDSDDHMDDNDDHMDDNDDHTDDRDDHTDDSDDHTDDSDDSIQDDDDDSDDDGNIFDNADDILVDVGKPVTEGDVDKSVETIENEDEMNEEPLEEDDDESRNIDSDEENEEDNDYDDITNPLLENDGSKQQSIITEEEFVENAIY